MQKFANPFTIYARTLPSGSKTYYYQSRDENGKRSNPKSTGCRDPESAVFVAEQILYRNQKVLPTITLKDYSKDFFSKNGEYYRWKIINNKKLSPRTIERYEQNLNYQVLPYFGNYRLIDITRSEVKKFIMWACEKWCAKTVNNAQCVLNIILNAAVDAEIIPGNPAARLGYRRSFQKKRDLFTKKELRTIYHSEWTESMYKEVFLLACITGMRISEIAGLRKEDLHGNYILVAHTYSQQFGLSETTKGGYSRIVPIPEDYIFPLSEEYLFLHGKKPFHIGRMREHLVSQCTKCGIDCADRGLSTHALRAFFNTYLQAENVTDAKIKAVIGHKDSTMTGRYTYWKIEQLQEVAEAQKKLYEFLIN